MRTGALSARQTAREAALRLEYCGVPEPVASAEVLLAELLGARRSELAFYPESLTEEQAELYETWISRRCQREAVQRILGHAYFRSLRLNLDEHTLIPRPDTETVVDAALECIDRRGGFCRVLDIGTGSGAIAISIAHERPLCEVYATDLSEDALRVARWNAARTGAEVRFCRADVAPSTDVLESVEVLVSNPPYVRSADIPTLVPEVRDWDPRSALDGGADGLDFYRRIFAEIDPTLAVGADVVLEVGDGQAEEVLEHGCRAGYAPVGDRADLAGTTRAVLLRWEPKP